MATANRLPTASITVGEELAAVAERLRRCTVQVRGINSGSGSGVIWRPDGLVVTNAHVATSSRHTVQLSDGRVLEAELIRRDPRCDLAALRIPAGVTSSAHSRDASSLRPGELVLAVGNPLDADGALAVGVMSAAPKESDTFMRADIRLAPGNSGGPLADAEGVVLGINCMVVAGFGIAVTSRAVERFLAGDRCVGLTLYPVGVYIQRTPVFGLRVTELVPGSPAHLSGVLIGDVIVRVDGKWLESPEQLSHAIRLATRELSIDVLRAGRLERCEIGMPGTSAAEVA